MIIRSLLIFSSLRQTCPTWQRVHDYELIVATLILSILASKTHHVPLL